MDTSPSADSSGVGVVEVVQRAEEQPRGSSEQDAQWAAEDPDQQADQASARGAREALVAGFVLDVDATVVVAGHDNGLDEVDLFVTVQLLDGREPLVGFAVVGERDDDDLVGADGVGIGDGVGVERESGVGHVELLMSWPGRDTRPRESAPGRW